MKQYQVTLSYLVAGEPYKDEMIVDALNVDHAITKAHIAVHEAVRQPLRFIRDEAEEHIK